MSNVTESLGNIDSITDKEKIGGKNGSVPISSHVHGENKDADLSALQIEKHNDEPVDVPVKSSSNLEIASLSLGEVNLSLNFNLGKSEFYMSKSRCRPKDYGR